MTYKHLQWDSDFFGYNVAEILNVDLIDKIIPELKNNNYKLAYLKTNPSNSDYNIKASDNGGILVDEKTTFLIDINKPEYSRISLNDNIVPYENNFVNTDLLDLAYQSGEFSRFKIDENFKPNRFKDLYRIWIERSVKKEIANEVLVFKIDGRICGMITLSFNDSIGNIGLIGVDLNYRGKNIGSNLINASIKYFLDNNYKKIDVVTQKANILACKFYIKNNFSLAKIENIYHFWL